MKSLYEKADAVKVPQLLSSIAVHLRGKLGFRITQTLITQHQQPRCRRRLSNHGPKLSHLITLWVMLPGEDTRDRVVTELYEITQHSCADTHRQAEGRFWASFVKKEQHRRQLAVLKCKSNNYFIS